MLGNSLRLRLSKGDLNVLKESGIITEQVNFPNGQILSYSLSRSENSEITAEFDDSAIKAYIPDRLFSEWINTERVGFDQNCRLSSGSTFGVLIEKDFKCLTDRPEDESDLFPHPSQDNINC